MFECLGQNLFDHQQKTNIIPKELLRKMAKELLEGLKQLRVSNVMHCDLKPENIVFTNSDCTHVKIIDFGSACDSLIKGYTYLQSRAYRSPEVAMGIPITPAIDMWSLGCILSELDTRRVLFQARDELELLTMIRLKIGDLPEEMVNICRRKKDYFDANGRLLKSEFTKPTTFCKPSGYHAIKGEVINALDEDFMDFI